MALLEIRDLTVEFPAGEERLRVVDGVSLAVEPGQAVGIVGESGSGKSMTALAVMGLLPENASASGSVTFSGEELFGRRDAQMSRIRGRRIGMVFQEPMTALNPVRTIGDQVAEGPRLHFGLGAREAGQRASDMLDRVGLPADRFPRSLYPHELSGGQRQRVVIAIALACGPDLLIADEPTSALDVTVQAQVLDLLAEITADAGMALLMISHDLGVIAEMTDRMAVMHSGRFVEEGTTEEVFARKSHPYTQRLFAALPSASWDAVEP